MFFSKIFVVYFCMASRYGRAMSTDARPETSPWKLGLLGARANLVPGLALQAVALTIVWAYYNHLPTRTLLEQLSAFRTRTGLVYTLVATPLFGGLIPFLILRMTPSTRAAHPWPHLLFFLLFWAYKGAEVDFLYRGLAHWIGPENTPIIVAKKVLFDQLVYNTLWATPSGVLMFCWRDAGFRWSVLRADLVRGQWYRRRVLPAMLSTWGVWAPAVTLIYSLPSALQVPMFNLVLCFWMLLFSFVMKNTQHTGSP